jgi:hypothetical protein
MSVPFGLYQFSSAVANFEQPYHYRCLSFPLVEWTQTRQGSRSLAPACSNSPMRCSTTSRTFAIDNDATRVSIVSHRSSSRCQSAPKKPPDFKTETSKAVVGRSCLRVIN